MNRCRLRSSSTRSARRSCGAGGMAQDVVDALQVGFVGATRPQIMASASPSFTISEAMMVLERRTAALATLGRGAVALHELVVGFPILAEAWIVFGLHTSTSLPICMRRPAFQCGRQ